MRQIHLQILPQSVASIPAFDKFDLDSFVAEVKDVLQKHLDATGEDVVAVNVTTPIDRDFTIHVVSVSGVAINPQK